MKGLVLEILDCRCTCGNKWTHSRPILCTADGGYGGTPSPRDEASLPVVRIYHSNRDASCCHFCGPIALQPNALAKLTAVPTPAAAPDLHDPFNFAQELGLEKKT